MFMQTDYSTLIWTLINILLLSGLIFLIYKIRNVKKMRLVKMESLKKHILQLENNLLKPEIRQSSENISELLSDGFIEFCSSGYIYRYNKGESFDGDTNLQQINWEIKDFEINPLSDDCLFATYKLIKHSELNESKKYSLRSSIWKCFNGKLENGFSSRNINISILR